MGTVACDGICPSTPDDLRELEACTRRRPLGRIAGAMFDSSSLLLRPLRMAAGTRGIDEDIKIFNRKISVTDLDVES